MGSLNYQTPSTTSPSLLRDLKVTIHSSSLIFPFQETERKSMFLSNIDKVLNFDVQTVHFFRAHKDFPDPRVLAEKVRETLGKILVPYDFLAGRLKLNGETGHLEIDCNASGAGFVVASSEFTLDEIGDLVYPNPAFEQLASTNLDISIQDATDRPLCIVQVTSFKCGGFAMGFTTNHTTFDGLSFKLFLENLAALAANKPLAIAPCNDRQLLAARSPPQVTFPHPELLKLNIVNQQEPDTSVFQVTNDDLVFKIFPLSFNDISNLKDEAKFTTSTNTKGRMITSFNVVTAFIWRCKALSYDVIENMERESTILYAVDIRQRLNPPLPKSYTGNAVLTAYATGKCKELVERPFCKIVEMVAEGARRMTNDYARSTIDWGEVNKGFPRGEVLISSWWRLGFTEVEYPWGKPRYSCPVVYNRKDIVLLFPNIEGDDCEGGGSRKNGGGVNILLALPAKEMVKFEELFNNYLFGLKELK
ncbi:hypothetical protein UlMin_015265 [Ulmus minor]